MTVLLDPRRATTAPFDLERHGDRAAVVTADGTVSYADLARRAADLARDVLGPTRRLVMVEGANHLDAVTAYLAALQHGHVALLVPDAAPEQRARLVAAYDPDVVLGAPDGGAGGWRATERRQGSAHELHPDLALLLSTSGSTGSPKLVRLSTENVRSNAESIATYLRLGPDDRAATTLPLHYCYGLSVLHSHLAVGAAVVLTDLSVLDACFWDLLERTRATSFAGVPYTFDLLDRSGFADRRLPSLRLVTQAGGRLAPERVRRYAEQGRRDGWELVVMYGQTEATARMAYLPPELATTRPEAVGVAVPGGSLRVDPVPEATEPGVGELVYTGPNVMLGYAESPADLALGRAVTELRTGDLARVRDGLVEVVGRRDRYAKLFGLRLDLDHVERALTGAGSEVRCVVADDQLHVVTTRRRRTATLGERAAALCGLPASAVRVTVLEQLPLTPSGKTDLAAIADHVRAAAPAASPEPGTIPVTPDTVRDELATVLRRPDATVDSTFVSLGGDSLSYVELATRLGRHLGGLPPDWHTRSAADLAAQRTSTSRPRRGAEVEVSVLLRALAIVAIVATHANLLTVVGGAHVLLAVAGFNLARFHLAAVPRATRVRHGLVAVLQVAVPSTVIIGGVSLVTGFYDPSAAFYLTGLLGSDDWTVEWQLWFLEALVWLALGLVALSAVPWFDRWERRAPYGTAVVAVALTLGVRFAWVGLEAGPTERYTVGVVAWCVAVGWLAARARTTGRRLLAVLAAAAGALGFFGDLQRELLVVAGVAALAFVPSVRVPRPLDRILGVLAASSLYVYLTHWQVYPHLEVDHPLLATLASFAVGLVCWLLARPAVRALGSRLRGPRAGSVPG